MEKKRKTELDIDLDLNVDDLLAKEKEEAPPPPEEVEEPKEKGPGLLGKLIEKFKQIPPKIIIFTGVGVLVLLLIAGIIAYFSTRPEPPPEVEETVKEEKKEEVTFKIIPQYEFTPFFFPIKAENNKEVFLKLAFSFDLSNEMVLNEIEHNIALLRANLSFAMKKKSLADIKLDPDKTKLGQEILNILNRSLQKGTAVKVYFTQFLIK